MLRISQSLGLRNHTPARKRFTAAAFAVAAGLLLLAAPQTGFAANTGDGSAADSAPIFDINCAQRDLELLTLIERNGNGGLSATATLVEASDYLYTARATCQVGDVSDALALYDTGLRRLEHPSDIARR